MNSHLNSFTTIDNLEYTVDVTCMSLSFGIKPEETNTEAGKTCKPHKSKCKSPVSQQV